MNPWCVEVSRGHLCESQHIGHGIAMTASGDVVLAFGEIDRPTFPRSAAKWVQALELVASGASDAFQLSDAELAIACASHNGEPDHTALVASWLARLGLSEADLECGIAPAFTESVRLAMARDHTPLSQLHHCCSGKHTGMLTVCRHRGWPTKGYTEVDHPLQQAIRSHMNTLFECDTDRLEVATDGCSVPTYALPLRQLAFGFARLGAGHLPTPLKESAERLFHAQVKEPFMVAGSDRVDTALLEAGAGRLQVKMGAEGVYCGALPDRHIGFALKCEDGSLRGQEALVIALLEALDEVAIVNRLPESMRHPTITTARGLDVGAISVRRET